MLVAVCVAAEASQAPQPSGHSLRQLQQDDQAKKADQATHADFAAVAEKSTKLTSAQCTKNADATACPTSQVPGCCVGNDCQTLEGVKQGITPALIKDACEKAVSGYYACCKAAKNGQSMVGMSFLSFVAAGVTLYVCS